jgi:hypothetical protein
MSFRKGEKEKNGPFFRKLFNRALTNRKRALSPRALECWRTIIFPQPVKTVP